MKTVAALILVAVGLMLPSSLSAATISYEHPFTLQSHEVFPGFPGSEGIIDRHDFGILMDSWDVPTFDPAFGTSLALFLDLFTTGGITVIVEPPDAEILLIPFLMTAPITGERIEAFGHWRV